MTPIDLGVKIINAENDIRNFNVNHDHSNILHQIYMYLKMWFHITQERSPMPRVSPESRSLIIDGNQKYDRTIEMSSYRLTTSSLEDPHCFWCCFLRQIVVSIIYWMGLKAITDFLYLVNANYCSKLKATILHLSLKYHLLSKTPFSICFCCTLTLLFNMSMTNKIAVGLDPSQLVYAVASSGRHYCKPIFICMGEIFMGSWEFYNNENFSLKTRPSKSIVFV